MMNKIAIAPSYLVQASSEHWLMRLLSILPAAVLMTFCLLYAMHLLVHQEYDLQPAKPMPPIPEVVMNTPPDIQVLPDEPPVRPVEQLPPPVIEIQDPVTIVPDTGGFLREPPLKIKPKISSNFGFSGQMVPIIRIAPQYPQAALAKGVEGYVDVIFDVTAIGTTENIRILEAVPSSVFNRSVLKAVSGWKYKPNVVNGVAVKTPDVRDRVRFNMEK